MAQRIQRPSTQRVTPAQPPAGMRFTPNDRLADNGNEDDHDDFQPEQLSPNRNRADAAGGRSADGAKTPSGSPAKKQMKVEWAEDVSKIFSRLDTDDQQKVHSVVVSLGSKTLCNFC